MADRGRAVRVAASALGLGHLPVAPGTWASAGAAAVYLALRGLGDPLSYGLLAVLTALVIGLGVGVCPRATELYGSEDPRQFVLDEVAGYWLTCLLFHWRGPLATALAAFLAFRFFDVLKPPPIRRLERIPGAWGVMVDDLAAAVYAAASLYVVCYGVLDQLAGA
jgi:phosphatidylglycerophosphatase A